MNASVQRVLSFPVFVLAVLCHLASGLPAAAQDQVGLFVGGLGTESASSIGSGFDTGFRYRHTFAAPWSWEYELGLAFPDGGADDALLASGQLHLVRHLSGPPKVQPFLLLGAGAAHYNSTGLSDTGALATLGLGVDYRWLPQAGFRLDLRLLGLRDVVDPGWTTNGQLLWGATFSF